MAAAGDAGTASSAATSASDATVAMPVRKGRARGTEAPTDVEHGTWALERAPYHRSTTSTAPQGRRAGAERSTRASDRPVPELLATGPRVASVAPPPGAFGAPVSVTVRPLVADDREVVHHLALRAFSPTPGEAYDADRPRVDDDRRLVAELDGRVVGHLAAWALGHHLGGPPLPTAGISAVVVAPEARRAGVGGALLRAGLDAARGRGEPLATLFPLTRHVYRRHGFELAGTWPRVELAVAALTTLPRPEDLGAPVTTTPGRDDDVAACLALEQRQVAEEAAAGLVRPPAFGRRALAPGQHGALVLAHRGDELVGYLAYDHAPARDPHELYRLEVRELVAVDAATRAALWRVVGSSASAARTVTATVAPEDPLHLWLPEQATTEVPTAWRWMLRLLDPAGAVAGRRWPEHLDVAVPLRIEGPDGATEDRVLELRDGTGHLGDGGDGRVEVDLAALATWFTGYQSATRLASVGRLRGATAADLAALDAATRGPAPWVRSFF
ncbi:GNAT family N-acetyltransferase [Nitriliruptoraceae bacterium ZYF776]|nr:GNAT family N-acetyltransferase [Profundirhabdus halotolerans]